MGGPIGTTHGRVPPSNIMLATRHSIFGHGMEKAPSAPALCVRRRRHPGVLQLKKVTDGTRETLKRNWKLFTVPMFQVFLLSVFILYMFFDIPYVNFPEYAVAHLNVTEQESSYLVSGIGFFNTISMLLCGFIADWKHTRDYMLPLYGICITLAGVCVFITPHITSYFGMMVICNAYGFFISANYVLASVITLELLCLHGFQGGYGLLSFAEGLGNVLGPALVGYVHDFTGSYIFIFYFAGCGIVVSGLVVVFIEVYRRYNPDEMDDRVDDRETV
uniref:MFS domain-containing protein n=1 Tax=Steinernema glaseri TaxID=37863 RepID=A0A1I7ZIH8_9BILA